MWKEEGHRDNKAKWKKKSESEKAKAKYETNAICRWAIIFIEYMV